MWDVTDEPGNATATAPPVAARGKAYWRSLDQLADTPAFRDWVERRFPQSMTEMIAGGVDRRHFLQLMAASLGLAGLAGCRRPEIKALPYSKSPPKKSSRAFLISTHRGGSAAAASVPVLVESHEGRPTKIEGNPRQADSGGSSDATGPGVGPRALRPGSIASPGAPKAGQPSTWKAYDAFAAKHYAALRERKGKGLRILGEDLSSPLARSAPRALPRGHARGTLARL